MAIACPDCGTIQVVPRLRGAGKLLCCCCGNTLEHASGRGIDTPLALSLATLILLFPANLMTLLSVSIAGVERSSVLGSGIIGMWREGYLLLAIVVGLQGVVLPFLRFGMLSTVLVAVRLERQGPWTGMVFRMADRLDLWAMPDVFLIGAGVGYSRVAARLPLHIGAGGWALIAAAGFSMLTRATLDRRAVWRIIGDWERPVPGPTVACRDCDLVLPASWQGRHCPRCRARLRSREPFSLMRAAALVATGYLLYPVANYFPMSIDTQLGQVHGHTIAGGIEQLVTAGLWPLACIIFTTSIAIPLLKLVGLTWMIWSVRHHSATRLVFKTRLYRIIGEIGRWSNVDVFTIAIFLPLMQFNPLVTVQAAIGASAFLAVIVVTMLAVRFFDPRLMWDQAHT